MGTYIIHFDDKPWKDLDDELYYRCFEIPWFSTTKTTISRLTPYTKDSAYAHGYTEAEAKYREIRDELEKQAYQRGLADAWEAVRKIYNFDLEEREELFHDSERFNVGSICEAYSASEAIEKIRQYEQEKEEIKVGDEVEAVSGKAVIIEVLGNGKDVRYMYPDASTGFNDSCNVTRTGRHFPEIAEVLAKMKEEEG